MMKKLFVILSTVLIASCSSVSSIEDPSAGSVDGLTYYMPKKDFKVTIKVEGGKVTEVNLGTTPAYPDLSKQYVLNHGTNFFGKNTLDVGVNENGLLTSSKSTTVSGVNDAFKNLATSLGQLQTTNFAAPAATCTTDGDHIFTYSAVGTDTQCNVNILITKVTSAAKGHSRPSKESHSGIFYRQNEPYKITATSGGLNVSSIVFSPSDSKTLFLPVSKTFFANNEAEFEFKDGVPSKYKQDTDGELVALLKFPADIISSYFEAVGSVFDSFKSNDDKEASALASSLSLELAKMKYEACLEAIKAKDNELIKELECS